MAAIERRSCARGPGLSCPSASRNASSRRRAASAPSPSASTTSASMMVCWTRGRASVSMSHGLSGPDRYRGRRSRRLHSSSSSSKEVVASRNSRCAMRRAGRSDSRASNSFLNALCERICCSIIEPIRETGSSASPVAIVGVFPQTRLCAPWQCVSRRGGTRRSIARQEPGCCSLNPGPLTLSIARSRASRRAFRGERKCIQSVTVVAGARRPFAIRFARRR